MIFFLPFKWKFHFNFKKLILKITTIFQVRFLDLSNNRLTRLTNLTIRGLEQAEVIDLSNNRIASILPEAFFGFHHIRELDLSFNRLRTIKPGGFRGCLTLRTLKLRGLGLQHIAENALDDFKSLIELDLTDNQLTMPNTLAKLMIQHYIKLKILSLLILRIRIIEHKNSDPRS